MRVLSITLASTVILTVCILVHRPMNVEASGCACTFTPATLIEVVDAETSWFQVEGDKILVRFEGIQVPALTDSGQRPWCAQEGEKALEAREFVIRTLQSAGEILIDLEGKKREGIVRTGVYVDGRSIGQELLYKYLAVEADSGEANWCQ